MLNNCSKRALATFTCVMYGTTERIATNNFNNCVPSDCFILMYVSRRFIIEKIKLLRLNPEKTDFLWCATRRRCMHPDISELSVCGALIRPSTTVRDLGVLLESDLSMRRHVAWTVGCCFRQLRLIRSCIRSLPLGAAKAAVAAFVTSRVDRYNSLLAG